MIDERGAWKTHWFDVAPQRSFPSAVARFAVEPELIPDPSSVLRTEPTASENPHHSRGWGADTLSATKAQHVAWLPKEYQRPSNARTAAAVPPDELP
jgi:hypothetical protein